MHTLFVGDVIFTEEELQELYDRSRRELLYIENEHGERISETKYPMLFVAMVNAIKEYGDDDAQFWEIIYKKLLGHYANGKVYTELTKCIEYLASHNRIFFVQDSGKPYYTTILAHAMSPTYSMNAFFDLCFDIFSKDLSYNYEEDSDFYNVIAHLIRDKIMHDDNAIFLELNSKKYALRAGINGLAKYAIDKFSILIQRIMYCFDSSFNRDLYVREDTYLNELYNAWLNAKRFSYSYITQKRRHRHIVSDFKLINAKYVVDNNNVCISLPPIRLKDGFSDIPVIHVFDDNKEVFNALMDIDGTGIMMSIQPYLLDVFSIAEISLEKIRVIITHNGHNIYDSEDKLFRDILLMYKSNEVSFDSCEPGKYWLYVSDNDALSMQLPQSNLKQVDSNLYEVNAEDSNLIQYKNTLIYFSDENIKQKLWISGKQRHGVLFEDNNITYDVYDGDVLLIISDLLQINDLVVNINGARFRLSEFSSEKRENLIYFNLTECLDVCEPSCVSVYAMSSKANLFSRNVIKFNNINLTFDRMFYFEQSSQGHVDFRTDKYHYEKDFDLSHDYVRIPFDNGGFLYITIPMFKWQMNDERIYSNSRTRPYWIEDVKDNATMTLYYPKQLDCILMDIKGNRIKNIASNMKLYDIGGHIKCMDSSNNELVIIAAIGEEKFILCSIVTKSKFCGRPQISFNNRTLIWNPESTYIGDKNISFRLELESTEGLVFNKKYDFGLQEDYYGEDIKRGFYRLNIYAVKEGIIRTEEKMASYQVGVGDPKDLKYYHKTLEINKIITFRGGVSQLAVSYYIDSIRFLEVRDGFDFYRGTLYYLDQYGKRKDVNRLINDDGEYEKMNPIRMEMKDDNHLWLVAGLGKEGLDDFLCSLTMDNMGMLSNSDKNVKAIDYYSFTVKNK